MTAVIKHVIFDRDGVLNVESADGGYVQDWSQWQWIPGALEGLGMLGVAGVRISIASNQSGVGRGIVAPADLEIIHARMTQQAARRGGAIAGVFVCPHAPESGCSCRKPAPGLLVQAVEASSIPRQATVAVGDALRDVEAAWAADVSPVLVRTGKGRRTEAMIAERNVPVFADLRQFAAAVLADLVTDARANS